MKPGMDILLCAEQPPEDLRRVLEQGGCRTGWHTLDGSEPKDLAAYQMIVLDGRHGDPHRLQLCRRFRASLGERYLPILCVVNDSELATSSANSDGGPDAILRWPLGEPELLASLRPFLRVKELHDRLADKTTEVNLANRRLQQVHQERDREAALAQNLQQSLLPQALPEVSRARFAVHYAPCGPIGGDFYDVFRLDEDHVGLYLADAMSHGIAAGLLSILLRKSMRTKEINGRQYRLVPPGEVLQRLNHNLVELKLPESPFITIAYALFNHRDGTLCFARAGSPSPLYVARRGEPCLWQVEGSLLGVFDTEFPLFTQTLRPGDKMLLVSDGINTARFDSSALGMESLVACASRHRDLPIQEFVERLSGDLFSAQGRGDDVTLLGLEMCA